MQKDLGITVSVVPQGVAMLLYEAVKNGEALLTAAGAGDFAGFIEATGSWATKTGGPWQARIIWPYSTVSPGYMVRKDSPIRTVYDIRPGVKLADFAGSGGIPTAHGALLAWAKVDLKSALFVNHANYAASLQGVKDGRADIAFVARTNSSTVLPFADDCTLIPLDPTKDPEGAKRFLEVWPVASFMPVLPDQPPAWKGIPSLVTQGVIITREDTDAELVYNLTKWFHTKYDLYKDAFPDNVYMTLENLMKAAETMPVPVHPGTVKYLRELGKWTPAHEARQKANIEFLTKYVNGYADAMKKAEAAGIRIDPGEEKWLTFWNNYKKENGLPPLRVYTGL
ncbi:MAG: hypothetical protein N3E40_00305 [Dehalococcoidia bacterium]|nr:hypothetical protein [Dehalococcoidia bacterium]